MVGVLLAARQDRRGREPPAQTVQAVTQCALFAGIGPGHLDALTRYRLTQVRLARTGQSFGRPAFTQTEFTATLRAGADQHAIGAVSQGIFDECGRQLPGAKQIETQHIGIDEGPHIGAMSAAEDNDLGPPRAQRGQTCIHLTAQPIDRQARHVDAGRQCGDPAKRRR